MTWNDKQLVLNKKNHFGFRLNDIEVISLFCSITSIQQRLKAKTVSDLDYDEVLYHVLRSTQITFDSIVDEDSYEILKTYIQGICRSVW